MSKEKPELAACPFCGATRGNALCVWETKGRGWSVVCANEKCLMARVITYPHPTEAEAIAAWNRRHVCPDKNGKSVYAGDRVECVPLYHLRKVLPEIGIIEWCDLTFGWTIAVDKRKYALENFTTIELVQE